MCPTGQDQSRSKGSERLRREGSRQVAWGLLAFGATGETRIRRIAADRGGSVRIRGRRLEYGIPRVSYRRAKAKLNLFSPGILNLLDRLLAWDMSAGKGIESAPIRSIRFSLTS